MLLGVFQLYFAGFCGWHCFGNKWPCVGVQNLAGFCELCKAEETINSLVLTWNRKILNLFFACHWPGLELDLVDTVGPALWLARLFNPEEQHSFLFCPRLQALGSCSSGPCCWRNGSILVCSSEYAVWAVRSFARNSTRSCELGHMTAGQVLASCVWGCLAIWACCPVAIFSASSLGPCWSMCGLCMESNWSSACDSSKHLSCDGCLETGSHINSRLISTLLPCDKHEKNTSSLWKACIDKILRECPSKP